VKYLLDTDILSYVARESHAGLLDRMRLVAPQDLTISVITRAEVEFGLRSHPPRRLTLERMTALLHEIVTLALPEHAATHHCSLRLALQRAGTPIGANDQWIAAHALALGLTVVTNNDREFRRVPGLKVENWTH
jgi:tRNA(fMet)-specific endonuclease VapC